MWRFTSREEKGLRFELLQSGFTISQDYRNTNSPLMGKETAKNLFHNSVNLLFTSEKCIVSEAALSLMELVHKELKDTCRLHHRGLDWSSIVLLEIRYFFMKLLYL